MLLQLNALPAFALSWVAAQTYLCEEGDSTSVVKPRGQHHQQIIEQQRLKFQIELNCLVVELHIGHLERSKDEHSEQEFDCGQIQMKNRYNFD